MSVIKGEGRVPILFGTKSVPAGARTHTTYLARPDLVGEWPTVVIVPDAWGITPSTRDVARRLARQGVAALAVDLFRGEPPARSTLEAAAAGAFASVDRARIARDIADVVGYIVNPAGFWSNAEDGFAVLGLGEGGPHAVAAARADHAPLILAGAALDLAELAGTAVPVLGLYGREDELVTVDTVMQARGVIPQAEWVLYEGVGHHFMDDYLAGFDLEAYRDAVERIAGFCEKHLPPAR